MCAYSEEKMGFMRGYIEKSADYNQLIYNSLTVW